MKRVSEVSRRQFLNYALTGVGGFMAAGMLTPMVRFAIDPILKKKTADGMVAVAKVSQITSDPQKFNFKVHQVDGWYEDDFPYIAWIYKDKKDKIVALSPICKHLGCTVSWYSKGEHKNKFYCQCHGGEYNQSGKNIPGTPPQRPLDKYQYTIKDGVIYLGKPTPQDI